MNKNAEIDEKRQLQKSGIKFFYTFMLNLLDVKEES